MAVEHPMTNYSFFDLFQLVMLGLFLITFFGRTVYLRLVKNINPILLGGKKKLLAQIIELAFPIWLVLWVVEVIRAGLNLEFHILPAVLDTQIISGLALQIAGVLLSVVGYSLFIAALLSFGDSWR